MLKLLRTAGKGLASALAGAVGLAIGYGLWIGYWRLFPEGSPIADSPTIDPWVTITFFVSLVVVPLGGAACGAAWAWGFLSEDKSGG